MSDHLKKLVEEHRAEFDVYSTDPDLHWPGIEQGITGRQKHLELRWVWRVAAAFVIGVGLTLMLTAINWDYDGDALAYEFSPEWQETEQFYAQQISEKMAAIQSSNVELDPLIQEDFDLLDKAYGELKCDLADGADNEEVINAMISNYKIKLQILERILMEINDNEENGYEESFEL